MQAFAFSYGICAGVRGFLFSILSTRLMEQLRWVLHHAFVTLLYSLPVAARQAPDHNTMNTMTDAILSFAACSGQVFDALVRQPVEFFDKVELLHVASAKQSKLPGWVPAHAVTRAWLCIIRCLDMSCIHITTAGGGWCTDNPAEQ